jgi:hypothetical protein
MSDGDDGGQSVGERIRETLPTRKTVGKAMVILGVLAGLAAGFELAPVTTGAIASGAVAAVLGVPLVSATVVAALPRSIREPIGEAWLTLAYKAFDDPINYQNSDGEMRIREGDGDGPRYRFCKTFVGFDLECTPDAFGDAGLTAKEVAEHHSTGRTDGGSANIPEMTVPAGAISNATHTGFLPKEPDAGTTYVRTDFWLRRFADAATGARTERAQQEATKEFADGSPEFSDRQLMYLALGGAALGIVLSILMWVFIL